MSEKLKPRLECYFTDGGCKGCECPCHTIKGKGIEDQEFEKFKHEVFWESAMGTCIGSGDDMAYVEGLYEWLHKHQNSRTLVRVAYNLAKAKFGNEISIEAWNKLKEENEKNVKQILKLFKELQEKQREIWKFEEKSKNIK